MQTKRYSDAIKDYTRLLELRPTLVWVRVIRDAYIETGKFQEAVNDYNVFIKLHPEYPEVYFRREGAR